MASSTAPPPRKLLAEALALVDAYGPEPARCKLELLRQLAVRSLATAAELERLHELLLVWRAYPDDAAVLEQVEAMLASFSERSDLRRFRFQLADTGIAGTPLHYRFYWGMAAWLARRWAHLLHIDWAEVDDPEAVERVLHLLVLYCETPALDTMQLPLREWLDHFKGRDETDAAFVIRRFEMLPADAYGREVMYDALNLPIRLDPGPDTPSRTHAKFEVPNVAFQTRPRSRARPSLRRAAKRPPPSVASLSPARGARLIDLAREAMATRMRDLDAIAWADPADATLIDSGDGLSFAGLGLRPERRLMLEAVYVFVILKNGVPVGYFQAATLFGASELNYNLFTPWRGAEAAIIYARGVAAVRHWLGSDAFAVDPYQIGDGNPEAIRSGAFWFYYKMGFRPEDAARRAIVKRERAAMKRDRAHRSSAATLRELCGEYLYLYLDGKRRDDVVGKVHYGEVGLAVSKYIAHRFGSDREAAVATCSEEAAEVLGLRSLASLSPSEQLVWARWSPLLMVLPGVRDWSAAEKRALVGVVRAKGGRPERDYIRRFDRHTKLRAALVRLAKRGR